MTALGFLALAASGTLVRAAATGLDTSFTRRLVATLVVNIVGSFFLGLLSNADMDVRVAVGVGGLGAMTTFSTFAEQVECIGREGTRRDAASYVLATLIGGIGAAWLGLTLA